MEMIYLLVLTIYTYDGASIATHEIGSLEQCKSVGEEWSRTSRKFSYLCAPIRVNRNVNAED